MFYKEIDISPSEEEKYSIAASMQPGYYCSSRGPTDERKFTDKYFLEKFKKTKGLKSIEDLEAEGLDKHLIEDLQMLYTKGVRTIISLSDYSEKSEDRHCDLLKYIWENFFEGTTYITEIDGIKTGIKDYYPPTIEQLEVISKKIVDLHSKPSGKILLHCGYGIGRTGTVLTGICKYFSKDKPLEEVIEFTKKNYDEDIIETDAQMLALKSFEGYLSSKNREELYYEIAKDLYPHFGMPNVKEFIPSLSIFPDDVKCKLIGQLQKYYKELQIEYEESESPYKAINYIRNTILTKLCKAPGINPFSIAEYILGIIPPEKALELLNEKDGEGKSALDLIDEKGKSVVYYKKKEDFTRLFQLYKEIGENHEEYQKIIKEVTDLLVDVFKEPQDTDLANELLNRLKTTKDVNRMLVEGLFQNSPHKDLIIDPENNLLREGFLKQLKPKIIDTFETIIIASKYQKIIKEVTDLLVDVFKDPQDTDLANELLSRLKTTEDVNQILVEGLFQDSPHKDLIIDPENNLLREGFLKQLKPKIIDTLETIIKDKSKEKGIEGLHTERVLKERAAASTEQIVRG